jgi:hypothetical protein
MHVEGLLTLPGSLRSFSSCVSAGHHPSGMMMSVTASRSATSGKKVMRWKTSVSSRRARRAARSQSTVNHCAVARRLSSSPMWRSTAQGPSGSAPTNISDSRATRRLVPTQKANPVRSRCIRLKVGVVRGDRRCRFRHSMNLRADESREPCCGRWWRPTTRIAGRCTICTVACAGVDCR